MRNIGKLVPVVGALISGGFDLAETRIIADRAYKEFMEGRFVENECGNPEDAQETAAEEQEAQ